MGYRWDADVGLYVCRDRAVKFSKDVDGDDLVLVKLLFSNHQPGRAPKLGSPLYGG